MSHEPPKVRSLLKTNGKTIGEIAINPDGSFEGRITDRLTHVLWVAYLVEEFSNSMSLHPNVVSAIEGVERVDVVSAYPDWDVEMMESYYKNRPKGTFDA